MCVLIFSALFFLKLFLFLEEFSKILSSTYIVCHVCVKCLIYLSDFNQTITDSTVLSTNLIKIHLVGTKLSDAEGRMDRWTDMMKLMVTDLIFANKCNDCVYFCVTNECVIYAQQYMYHKFG